MILFTADWHIKLGQKNVPIEWQVNRFRMFFEKIEQLMYEHKCEIHIAGGDIFDRVPSLEELALFLEFAENTKYHTLIYDGNHEATKKGSTFLSIVANMVKNDKVGFITDYFSSKGICEADFDIIPYCRLKQFEKHRDFISKSNKLLFTHVRGEIPPHVHPEVDLDIFKDWELVVAGDLHSHENSQRNIVYPGSPMTTSFHRNLTSNGCVIIDGTDYAFVDLQLPQLLRQTITDEKDIVASTYHHTIFDIEGHIEDLANIDNNPLLDKKLVKRTQDVALILTPEMSLSQEVEEYLRYILGLKEETIVEVMKVFHDNTKNTTLG